MIKVRVLVPLSQLTHSLNLATHLALGILRLMVGELLTVMESHTTLLQT